MDNNITKSSPNSSNRFLPWIVCLTAALFFFYESIQLSMFNALGTDIMRSFGISATHLGMLSSASLYANVIFLFPAGMLLDRFSTRYIMMFTLALCILSTVGFALSTTMTVAWLCRFLTGVGSAFCLLGSIRLASRWFPSNRLALVTGLIVTMAMLGSIVAQTPLTLLSAAVGWRSAVLIDAGSGVIILGLIFSLVKDHPEGYQVSKYHDQIRNTGFWNAFKLSFSRKQNWFGGIYTSFLNLPVSVLGFVWGAPYLEQVRHINHTQASFITSMIFFGTIIGSPLMSWYSDHLGKRRTPMIYGAILALFLVLIIIYQPHSTLTELMALFFLLGLITSTQVISYPTIAESNPAFLTATAISVISICSQGGGALLQQGFGWLMDLNWNGAVSHGVPVYSTNDFNIAIMILPICFIIALIAASLLKETNCMPYQKETPASDEETLQAEQS